jgi:hypothetical protein
MSGRNSEETAIDIEEDSPAEDEMLRPEEKSHRTARILSSVAATAIALSCGMLDIFKPNK